LRLRNIATFYALDGETGKELYSSADQIKSWVHFGGLSVANGRVYLGTYDSILYCFGCRYEVAYEVPPGTVNNRLRPGQNGPSKGSGQIRV